MAVLESDQAQPPLILALDIGTSSVRALLYDAQARVVAGTESQHLHHMRSTADGGVETDAEALLERVCLCIDETLDQAGALGDQIAAIAPTTFWHNVLGVDAAGIPVTPLLTWADTRSRPAVDALRSELDPVQLHARTGCVLHPSYLLAKLRWLQAGPYLSAKEKRHIHRWLSFAEFMIVRFFGSPSSSISMASGSGLLNQHTCTWDEEVLRVIPVNPDQLSPLDDTPRRGLLPYYATRWPTLAHLPWFPGWGDGASSNVGCGCVTRRSVAVMVGTSGAMRTVWRARRFTIPPNLWVYRLDRRRVVLGGALSNGGNFIDWLRATLQVPADLQDLETQIAAMEPDAHGLTILPFLAGERSTGWHSDARATISGLSLHIQPAEIVRAGYETIAHRFALIHSLIRSAHPEARSIIASGGALLHSPAWQQILADVLGVPVTASAVPEASSRGAALLALERLGAISDIEDLPAPLGPTYQPNAARHRIYTAAATRQRILYERLIVQPLSSDA